MAVPCGLRAYLSTQRFCAAHSALGREAKQHTAGRQPQGRQALRHGLGEVCLGRPNFDKLYRAAGHVFVSRSQLPVVAQVYARQRRVLLWACAAADYLGGAQPRRCAERSEVGRQKQLVQQDARQEYLRGAPRRGRCAAASAAGVRVLAV